MKEILYIQAGPLANYVGTHFWNTQETYLSFEDPESSYIEHDVSFKEVVNGSTGQSMYCPRVLLFDRKANFGALARSNALGSEEAEVTNGDAMWSGDIHEHRQTTISKSTYHARLEETNDLGVMSTDDNTLPLLQNSSDIRYWSDFSRVFYVPNSIHAVPDPKYGEQERGDWKGGSELFSRYNENDSLMEGSVRLFLEECDYFQGLHVVNDVETFGGFTNTFLTAFQDDFSKASSMVAPILSSALFDFPSISDRQAAWNIINDALYLCSLSEIASMILPIQNPRTWPLNSLSHLVGFNKENIYQSSGVISTHLESSTLSLRLNRSRDSLADFCAQAKRYEVGSFCQLSGCVPVIPSTTFESQQFNFSATTPELDVEEWARLDVTRGFSPKLLDRYDQWHSDTKFKGAGTAISSIHGFAYPLPSSYPAIFRNPDFVLSPYKGKHAPPAIPVLSSISNNSGTTHTLLTYAEYIQNALRLGIVDVSMGLDTDELRELVNDLWTLHDSYPSSR